MTSDESVKTKKTYKPDKVRSVRVMISLPPAVLDLADEAAEKDYTTRSDIIRSALLWYIRPQGRDLDQTDPDVIDRVLRHRRLGAALNAMRKDLETQE